MDGSHVNTLWRVTNTCEGAISVRSVILTHWSGSGGASVSSQVARRLPLSFYAGGDACRCSREEIAEEIDVILLFFSFSPSSPISVFSFFFFLSLMAAAIITGKGGSGCLVVDGVEDLGLRRERASLSPAAMGVCCGMIGGVVEKC